jgi:hypothetical protein
MESLVLFLLALVRNATAMIGRAGQENNGLLYVPADMQAEELEGLLNQSRELRASNGRGQEPSYLSLAQANAGNNADGSPHKGYLIIDVTNGRIADLVDRTGRSKLAGKSVHMDTHSGGTPRDVMLSLCGMFAVQLPDGQFWVAYRCRCPSFHIDVFWRHEDAEVKAREVDGSAVDVMALMSVLSR